MDEYRINGLTIKENLLQLAENGNKKFTESLHPGIENVLGIRIPALRRLGAQIAKDDWESYLQTADTYYMEERMLQGMVISNLKMKDIEAYLSLVARFVTIINSWSVCDTFDFYGKQRFVDKNKKRVWLFLENWMKSDKEYEIRFGVVMAMAHYIDEEYINQRIAMDGPDQSRRILCEDGCSMGFIRMLCQISSKDGELSEGKSFR